MSEDRLKSIQKEAKRIAASFTAIASVKPKSQSFPQDMLKAVKQLLSSSDMVSTLERIRLEGTAIAEAEAKERAKAFGSYEAKFIRSLKEQGIPLRELNSAWRAGPIEIVLQRDESQARSCYNHEPLLGWVPVSAPEDLQDLYERSLATLAQSEIRDADLETLVARAFEDAYLQSAPATPAAKRVPIFALLRSMRIERFRQDLGNGNPGKAVRNTDMPLWALLYNLDRYRRQVARQGVTTRIGFETGSQLEQAQGRSVTLNGLSALQDYQVYAHAVQRD
jgi:hypothetical protein